jgi:hypothetical protein
VSAPHTATGNNVGSVRYVPVRNVPEWCVCTLHLYYVLSDVGTVLVVDGTRVHQFDPFRKATFSQLFAFLHKGASRALTAQDRLRLWALGFCPSSVVGQAPARCFFARSASSALSLSCAVRRQRFGALPFILGTATLSVLHQREDLTLPGTAARN